jgi:hypothetical protein
MNSPGQASILLGLRGGNGQVTLDLVDHGALRKVLWGRGVVAASAGIFPS